MQLPQPQMLLVVEMWTGTGLHNMPTCSMCTDAKNAH
eukprot:CAMPEP_0203752466 /NCGR_PEP_ID=MMETSP0098-20131031/6391_1 /ASSEMBLY_ACC=CAM_ASM_000208 /TAXON_ID=96639 /ORGANISM=" , Strain NY0313808BC1" /LENGTH=36 /DNA_ID= /DNA_START= /DNA_END= /DNA_ORIENTATION=